MSLQLPEKIREKVAALPEISQGANRVTLVLEYGRRIHDVVIAWAEEIVKVGERPVKEESDLGFLLSEVVDAAP